MADGIGGKFVDKLSGYVTEFLPGPWGAALGGALQAALPLVIPVVKAVAQAMVNAFLAVWRGIKGFFSWLGGLFGVGGGADQAPTGSPQSDTPVPGPGGPGPGGPGPPLPGGSGADNRNLVVEIGGRPVADVSLQEQESSRRFYGEG